MRRRRREEGGGEGGRRKEEQGRFNPPIGCRIEHVRVLESLQYLAPFHGQMIKMHFWDLAEFADMDVYLACRLFMGSEMVPLAAEDTVDPRLTIPKAMFRGISLTILLAFITLIVGASMPPGATMLAQSHYPLAPAMQVLPVHLPCGPGIYQFGHVHRPHLPIRQMWLV